MQGREEMWWGISKNEKGGRFRANVTCMQNREKMWWGVSRNEKRGTSSHCKDVRKIVKRCGVSLARPRLKPLFLYRLGPPWKPLGTLGASGFSKNPEMNAFFPI